MYTVPSPVRTNLARLEQIDPQLSLSINKGALALFVDAYSHAVSTASPWAEQDGFDVAMAIEQLVPAQTVDVGAAYQAIYGELVDWTELVEAVVDWQHWAGA